MSSSLYNLILFDGYSTAKESVEALSTSSDFPLSLHSFFRQFLNEYRRPTFHEPYYYQFLHEMKQFWFHLHKEYLLLYPVAWGICQLASYKQHCSAPTWDCMCGPVHMCEVLAQFHAVHCW